MILEDKSVSTFRHEVNFREKLNEKITVKEIVSNIQLWDIDSPHLYVLQLTLIQENQVIGKHDIRFGFREAIFLQDGFYLNGKKVKIRGLNKSHSLTKFLHRTCIKSINVYIPYV